MSTPSDPQRGGQQPDNTPDAGQPEQPGAEQQWPNQQGPNQQGQYQPPGQYGQYPPNQYGGQYGQQPQYGQPPPYGQAPPYGQQPAYGAPGAYGNQPYNPYGNQQQQPYGATDNKGGYAYSPYGAPGPYPTGLEEDAAVPRPGIMVGALILIILSALPFLVIGAAMVVLASTDILPPELLNDPRFTEAQLTPELLVTAMRVIGAVMAVIALLYVVFAVLAFRGRNWARVMVTVMTVGFALLLGASLVTGASGDVGSLGLLLGILVLSIGGTVLMYVPASARFFANPRS